MRNFLILVLALVSIGFAASGDIAYEVKTATNVPSDVVEVDLGTDGDAVEDSTYVVYGPYSMTFAKEQLAYSGYGIYADALAGTTPTAAIGYQLTWSNDTADIVAANWVTTDTISATGLADYVDLSSESAKFIYIRIHNYDATYDTLGNVKILFKK